MTKLAMYRKARGLSQSMLAVESGLSKRLIQQYEGKYRNINRAAAETVKILADTLGCNMEDLLE